MILATRKNKVLEKIKSEKLSFTKIFPLWYIKTKNCCFVKDLVAPKEIKINSINRKADNPLIRKRFKVCPKPAFNMKL